MSAFACVWVLACSGDPDVGYDVAVRVSARVPVLEAVEVVLTAEPCTSPAIGSGLAASTTVASWRGTMTGADGPALGVVPAGRYALAARGFEATCRVVAAGCTEARIDADGRGELEVLLDRIEGAGCALGQTCGLGGRCAGQALACGPSHIGPWRTTSSLPSPRVFAGLVAIRDELVAAGGGADRVSPSTDVHVASIGAGAGIGAWSMRSPLPLPLTAPALASDGRHLFVVGGLTTDDADALVASAAVLVSPDGGARSWVEAMLPAPRIDHAAFVALDALYVVGGRAELGGAPTASVLRAMIGAEGAPGSWSEAIPLPVPSVVLATFVRHNRVYAITTERTFVAVLRADGIGPWARIEQPLPVGGEPAIVLAQDAVMLVGGARSDGTQLTDVHGAALDDAGGMGPWRRVSALPAQRLGARVVAHGVEIAVVGGVATDGTSPPSLLARHCAM